VLTEPINSETIVREHLVAWSVAGGSGLKCPTPQKRGVIGMCPQKVVEASIRIVKPDVKQTFMLSRTANKSAADVKPLQPREGTTTRSVAPRTATLEEFIAAAI